MRGVATKVFVALALATACQSSEYEGGLDLERMVDQRGFDAYDATSLFADSMAMRTPPEGVLPFGEALPAVVRTGHQGGAPVARIPVPVDSVLLAEGRREFGVYCTPCHGHDGNAVTPVAAVMELRPPPALHADRIRAMPPGHLFDIVSEGYGLMPGYATALDPRERWAVVAYVRALQLSRRLPLDTLPPAARADLLRRIEEAVGARADTTTGGGAP